MQLSITHKLQVAKLFATVTPLELTWVVSPVFELVYGRWPAPTPRSVDNGMVTLNYTHEQLRHYLGTEMGPQHPL